jgi:predicted dehydrogenase
MISGGGEKVLRVGIVGANPAMGWGSGVHRRVIARLPRFTLQGVCTTKRESAERAAREFGAPLWFTDAAELSRHPEIDLVSICVKAPHHFEIALRALQAGKHVYCEWPLAFTVAQAEELTALAHKRGLKAMIGLHLHGAPAMCYAADLVRNGYIGKPLGVSLHARVFGPIMGAMATRAGGTTLTSIYAGHLLDALDYHFGGIGDLSARAATHLPPIDETGAPIARDAADHLLIQGTMGNRALFSVDLAGASLVGLGSTWRIEGSEGMLVLSSAAPDMPAMEALSVHGARLDEQLHPLPIPAEHDCDYIPPQPERYSAYPGSDASRAALASIAKLYQRLGEAILMGGSVDPDFARAVRVQQRLAEIDAMTEPAADGSSVPNA